MSGKKNYIQGLCGKNWSHKLIYSHLLIKKCYNLIKTCLSLVFFSGEEIVSSSNFCLSSTNVFRLSGKIEGKLFISDSNTKPQLKKSYITVVTTASFTLALKKDVSEKLNILYRAYSLTIQHFAASFSTDCDSGWSKVFLMV